MPLPRYVNRAATTIGNVELRLLDPTGVVAERRVVAFYAIRDQNGALLDNVTYDVTDIVPASLKTTLSNALTQARQLGVTDILPQ